MEYEVTITTIYCVDAENEDEAYSAAIEMLIVELDDERKEIEEIFGIDVKEKD